MILVFRFSITQFIPQQTFLKEHFTSRAPTQLSYIERSVGVKHVDTHFVWFLNLWEKSGFDVPIHSILGSQNNNRIDKLAQSGDVFKRQFFISAECNIGTESFPGTGKLQITLIINILRLIESLDLVLDFIER